MSDFNPINSAETSNESDDSSSSSSNAPVCGW